MAVHPLFDPNVIECIPGITDSLVGKVPMSVARVDVIVRPGPAGDESAATIEVIFPDNSAPADWTAPDALLQAGRSLAAAWTATGHAMPAFQFHHKRLEDGRWQSNASLLTEW